ncbi:MAG: clostripain-related cysteine peptidase, partial [Candidatus Dependentiae bacterium]
ISSSGNTSTESTLPQREEISRAQNPQKEWTVLVYFAGVNNLGLYVPISLMQMQDVGGCSNMNIVAEVDKLDTNQWLYKDYTQWGQETGYPALNIVDTPTKRPPSGDKNIVRLEAGKNKIFFHESAPKKVGNASGTRTALYDFIRWGVQNFPAKNYALFVWNHGSGALDLPETSWNYAPEVKNPAQWPPEERRGIASNDIRRTFLSGAYFAEVLEAACKNLLPKGTFDLLCLDACLMAMVESCIEFGKYADYIIASQESGWGSGWNYAESLRPLTEKNLSPRELAQHLVVAYRREMLGEFVPPAYKRYHQVLDFTLSAVDTTKTDALNSAIDALATGLNDALKPIASYKGINLKDITDPETHELVERGRTVHNAIKNVRTNKTLITTFYDDSYIDLHQFCQNVRARISPSDSLFALLSRVENAIVTAVIKNTHAPITLPHARGLSIYFPKYRKYPTYAKTRFAQTNTWDEFLTMYRKAL